EGSRDQGPRHQEGRRQEHHQEGRHQEHDEEGRQEGRQVTPTPSSIRHPSAAPPRGRVLSSSFILHPSSFILPPSSSRLWLCPPAIFTLHSSLFSLPKGALS